MEQKVVLLVDDDIDFLFQMRFGLEKHTFEVLAAESQKEAEKILETVKPDIAVIDLMMEQEDSGFILCYRLKNKYPDVPVIIVTGVTAETGMSFNLTSEEDQKWIKADLYLQKGITSEQLRVEINKLLRI
jgi:two-component system, OmpR family, response regulator